MGGQGDTFSAVESACRNGCTGALCSVASWCVDAPTARWECSGEPPACSGVRLDWYTGPGWQPLACRTPLVSMRQTPSRLHWVAVSMLRALLSPAAQPSLTCLGVSSACFAFGATPAALTWTNVAVLWACFCTLLRVQRLLATRRKRVSSRSGSVLQ